MRFLAFRSGEVFKPLLPKKCVRQPSFAAMFEYSTKKHPHNAKNSRFEIKRCSKFHLTVAQPQLVLNLFLTFDQF